MATLARAIAIAATAHEKQTDKSGAAYILHPLRMMMRLEGELEKIVAVLHDLIEDTDWTPEKLAREGFEPAILSAVDCLTKRGGENYDDFVARVKTNPIAIRVKIADIEDNMDMKRIASITPKDLDRLAKYHRHWGELKTLAGG